jgi:hypothetical protein
VDFTVTGAYGTTPTIYIDNKPASNQGFTQDANNYYVWYLTYFSTHKVSIVFATGSSIPEFPSIAVLIALAIGALCTTIAYKKKERKITEIIL